MADEHPGGRRRAIDPEDILEVIKEQNALFMASGEIAEAADVSKPTVLDRLETLEDRGQIKSKRVASNVPVYYLPELENYRPQEYNGSEAPVGGSGPNSGESVGDYFEASAGAQLVSSILSATPRTTKEWEAAENAADHLISGCILALLSLFGGVGAAIISEFINVAQFGLYATVGGYALAAAFYGGIYLLVRAAVTWSKIKFGYYRKSPAAGAGEHSQTGET